MQQFAGFRRFALLTIVAVYFLILVGGIVRATGSGMGCPDWPKCFGRWIPPTAEEELPPDYQEIYGSHGYAEDRFNAAKTWTEYVNRLIGVVIGLLIFVTLLLSLRFWRRDRAIVWWSLAAFLLVGFQGWLGSVVVDSNLAVWLVTVHMLVALVIVGVLLYVWTRSHRDLWRGTMEELPRADLLFVGVLGLSLLQIAVGTQVREQIDEIARDGVERSGWIEALGLLLSFHRSYSLLLMALIGVLVWAVWKRSRPASVQRRIGAGLLVVIGLEIAAGAAMYYFAVPAFLQPVHLLLAALGIGLLFTLWLAVRAGMEEGAAVPA